MSAKEAVVNNPLVERKRSHDDITSHTSENLRHYNLLELISTVLGSHAVHVLICILGGLVCFVPLFAGLSSLENSSLRSAIIAGGLFRESSLVSLTLVAPLSYDWFLDSVHTWQLWVKKQEDKAPFRAGRFSHSELAIILVGFIITPCTAFLPEDTPNLALIYDCCRKCEIVLVLGVIASSLSRFSTKHWSGATTTLALLLLVASQVLSVYYDNEVAIDGPLRLSLQGAVIVSVVLSATVFYSMGLYWLCEERLKKHLKRLRRWFSNVSDKATEKSVRVRKSRQSEAESENTGSRVVPMTEGFGDKRTDVVHAQSRAMEVTESDAFFQTCFVAILVICASFIILAHSVFGLAACNLGDTALFTSNVSMIATEFAITILVMRRTKSDVIQGLLTLIDAKKTYVRYISHELRTPLNSAFLGLKLLIDDFKSSREEVDEGRLDTTRDVSKSVLSAVEILDGLLCVDSIENGIMELRKQSVCLLPFMEECIKPFIPQARECGIKLSFHSRPRKATASTRLSESGIQRSMSRNVITNTISTIAGAVGDPSRKGLEILPSDLITVDRFKVNQVLRNLISNALKFTPRDKGSVEIRVAFVPNPEQDTGTSSKESSIKMPALRSMKNFVRFGSAEKARFTGEERRSKEPSTPNPDSKRHSGNGDSDNDKPWWRGSMKLSSARLPTNRVRPDSSVHSSQKNKYIKGKLRITVHDTGIGMSKENQKRLFTEIVQFNPEVLQSGGSSGLGLLISKGIVDLHGGKIKVYSEGEGKGSTFTVELPMRRRAEIAVRSRNASDRESHNSVRLMSRRPSEGDSREISERLKRIRVQAALKKGGDMQDDEDDDDEEEDDDEDVDPHAPPRAVRAASSRSKQSEGVDSLASSLMEALSKISDSQSQKQKKSPNGSVHDKVVNDSPDKGGEEVRSPGRVATGEGVNLGGVTRGSNSKLVAMSPSADVSQKGTATQYVSRSETGFTSGKTQNFASQSRKENFKVLPAVEEVVASGDVSQEGSGRHESNRSPMAFAASAVQKKTDGDWDAVAHAMKKPSLKHVGKAPSRDKPSYKVLIVDDSAMTRKMLRKTLMAAGHFCEEAEDGKQAVDKVAKSMESGGSGSTDIEAGMTSKRCSYDAILMDFVMPVMDGPTATQKIKQLVPDVPVFGVTGNTVDMDIARFLDCGATKVFAKPFDLLNFHTAMVEAKETVR